MEKGESLDSPVRHDPGCLEDTSSKEAASFPQGRYPNEQQVHENTLTSLITTNQNRNEMSPHTCPLVAQGLRICTPNAGGTGAIPDQGTKIPHATWCSQ